MEVREIFKPIWLESWVKLCSPGWEVASVVICYQNVWQLPWIARRRMPRKIGLEHHEMVPSPMINHLTTCNATSPNRMIVPESGVPTVSPADVKKANGLYFDQMEIMMLFKKNKNVPMFIKMLSHVLRQVGSDIYTSTVLSMAWESFLPMNCTYGIRHVQKGPLKSTAETPVYLSGKVSLFVQLVNLHVHVHFVVLDKPGAPIFMETSSIDKFSGFYQLFIIWSDSGMLLSPFFLSIHCSRTGWLLQSESETESNADDQIKNKDENVLFQMVKRLNILPSSKTPVFSTNSTGRRNSRPPYLNCMSNRKIL